MRAIHKYREAARRGNKEAQRRISQSMGYKHTIYDMPDLIKLLYRAGIEIDGIDYELLIETGKSNTVLVEDSNYDKGYGAESTTLKL
tara:strand:+ start:253 stop:513 length:261 start_codon:yes stop_codon:yes gene_type:complete